MNFLSNFVNSIGAMDGNQWAFVELTNAATCGITYYATRKAYEVDDEEDKKPTKLKNLKARKLKAKEEPKAKQKVREAPKVEVVVDAVFEAVEEPKVEAVVEAVEEPKVANTNVDMVIQITAELMVAAVYKGEHVSDDFRRTAIELVKAELKKGSRTEATAEKECEEMLAMAQQYAEKEGVKFARALRTVIKKELEKDFAKGSTSYKHLRDFLADATGNVKKSVGAH